MRMRATKRKLVLTSAEYRLLFHGLLQFRNKLIQQGRCPDDVVELLIKLQKAKVTEIITELRKRKKMAMAIEDRSTRIDTAMEQLMANEEKEQQKTRPNYERSYTR